MRKLLQVFAGALIAALLVPVPAAGAKNADRPLRWVSCHADVGPNFQCASVRVPLDYDRPNGRHITLALARLPATDPGAPDRLAVPQPGRAGRLGRRLRPRRRPVPVHRRGARALRPRRVRPPRHHQQLPAALLPVVRGLPSVLAAVRLPVTPRRGGARAGARPRLNAACQRRGGPDRGPHGDGRRGARPRPAAEAVGDAGSPTPATRTARSSASLREPVPARVRAVVVDGVLDPIAWTTGRGGEAATHAVLHPAAQRRRRPATLGEFFRLCDAAGDDAARSRATPPAGSPRWPSGCAPRRSRSPTRSGETSS